MVWQIVNKVDTEIAKKEPIWARSPFIEYEGLQSEGKSETFKAMCEEQGFNVGCTFWSSTIKFYAKPIRASMIDLSFCHNLFWASIPKSFCLLSYKCKICFSLVQHSNKFLFTIL